MPHISINMGHFHHVDLDLDLDVLYSTPVQEHSSCQGNIGCRRREMGSIIRVYIRV